MQLQTVSSGGISFKKETYLFNVLSHFASVPFCVCSYGYRAVFRSRKYLRNIFRVLLLMLFAFNRSWFYRLDFGFFFFIVSEEKTWRGKWVARWWVVRRRTTWWVFFILSLVLPSYLSHPSPCCLCVFFYSVFQRTNVCVVPRSFIYPLADWRSLHCLFPYHNNPG